MSAQRLAVFVLPVLVLAVLVLVCSAAAQDSSNSWVINQLSVTGGRTFVSTQTVPSTGLPLHFGNPGSFAVDYSRLLKSFKIFGLSAEVPVGIYPKMGLNYYYDQIPRNVGALFVTPSVRLNIFSNDSVTPWVSVGGGYGRYWQSSNLIWYGANPGPSGTNTGVVQFGGGLDVWFWHRWGARMEVRDFYSGVPDLNIDTGRSRQHNYYVGAGVVHRF
ncbi:MAG: hypothetical protein ACLPHI_09895 [Terriglobales bacterium]|jgi:hypothetical protein